MALDLSALGEEYGSEIVDGKFQHLSLSLVIEDPDQPRGEFPQAALDELAEDIKIRGVMQPILVRPADENGIHKIIVGARRYRASLLAQLEEIPAIIRAENPNLDDYAQVAENTKRAPLTTIEMARFIEKRLNKGDTKAEISRGLGMDKSAVTQYSALIDPPQFFVELYVTGKCTNALYFYELRKIHNQWPSEVEEWCERTADITRPGIQELYQRLRGPDKNDAPKVTVTEATGLSGVAGIDRVDGGSGGGAAPAVIHEPEQPGSDDTGQEQKPGSAEAIQLPSHNPEIEKKDATTVDDPNKLKKPLLLVSYEDREAMLLLHKRPTTAGLVHIRYEDGSGEDEVEAGKLKINLLTEASK